MVYICNGILLSQKKSEILPFTATWMDLEGIMLSEISQTKKEKYHMISLICGISKTIKINEQTKPNKNKHVDTENRVVAKGRRGGREEGKRGKGHQL